eukprot:TRINITY_DN8587_c0_g1_i2.p1 TRINITY_DN8587_c0_g1~~TRINITY_DN8587_c0_g1_i2.p1  ORF type:complete len:230 (-),score=54.27 TRINITY_DN8587_c0_g1_i2:143-832(-)
MYPVPLVVRNTFIDCQDRPPSLDEFMLERKAVSCPVSLVSNPGDDEPSRCSAAPASREDVALLQPALLRSKTGPAAAVEDSQKTEAAKAFAPWRRRGATASQASTEQTALPQDWQKDTSRSECSTADTAEYSCPPSPDHAVRATSDKEQSSPSELPSVGSADHERGTCKPCAFLHSKGCVSGSKCQFCHLCDSGEKKKRQKEKRAYFINMRQQMSAAVKSVMPASRAQR